MNDKCEAICCAIHYVASAVKDDTNQQGVIINFRACHPNKHQLQFLPIAITKEDSRVLLEALLELNNIKLPHQIQPSQN